MKTPYIGFNNESLSLMPEVKAGDLIDCDKCGQQHPLLDGTPKGVILFYNCCGETYIGGINGRCIVGYKADVKGEV